MANELQTKNDVLDNEVQSCKETSPQQTKILEQVKNFVLNICYPYSRDYDHLDQSLYLVFYLIAIVLVFIILFVAQELSFGEDNGVTSYFVQERYVDILIISYMTPAILWTVCLFLIKDDGHTCTLVFDNNSVSYKRPLFYSVYLLGGGFFISDILQVAFYLPCSITDNVGRLYLSVEAMFVITQMLFQVLFLNASFLARSSAKLAVIHMIGSNIAVLIKGIFRKSSNEMQEFNHSDPMRYDILTPTYCEQTQNALSKIMDVFQLLNSQFLVITLITLSYIFINVKGSQNEVQRYSPTTKILRCRQNISIDTTVDTNGSGSGSSVILRNKNITTEVNVGLLAGLILALLLLSVGQLHSTSGGWLEVHTMYDICYFITMSAMLCINWLIAWVLHNYHPFYDRTPFTPTEGILVATAIGLYAWNIFKIILNMQFITGALPSFILKSLSKLLIGYVQTFVISKTMGHSLRCHGNYKWRKPMAEAFKFLIVCNAAIALNETFFATTDGSEPDVTLFSIRMWTVLTSLTHSLDILYFLHSSLCFLDISFKYQDEIAV